MNAFSRTELLLGKDALATLRRSRVAVFGIGGVGSFTVEALARSGIGHFALIDDDLVCLTNINRQLLALHSTIGRPKVDVMAERVRDINPAAQVECLKTFYLPENADAFDLSRYDYVVDAVDTVSAKVELAVRANQAGVPLVSCMGAGNKLDPTRFEVADLFTTSVCPLCKVMRKELKRRGIESLKVVYSRELPLEPLETEATSCSRNCVCPKNSPRTCTVRRRIPGSVAFVPSVAGLILAGEVVCALAASDPRIQKSEAAKVQGVRVQDV
jgi:tRNA A37 threonylcarbamoyladenosine dehydratase